MPGFEPIMLQVPCGMTVEEFAMARRERRLSNRLFTEGWQEEHDQVRSRAQELRPPHTYAAKFLCNNT